MKTKLGIAILIAGITFLITSRLYFPALHLYATPIMLLGGSLVMNDRQNRSKQSKLKK